jgi:hypothetical protein
MISSIDDIIIDARLRNIPVLAQGRHVTVTLGPQPARQCIRSGDHRLNPLPSDVAENDFHRGRSFACNIEVPLCALWFRMCAMRNDMYPLNSLALLPQPSPLHSPYLPTQDETTAKQTEAYCSDSTGLSHEFNRGDNG